MEPVNTEARDPSSVEALGQPAGSQSQRIDKYVTPPGSNPPSIPEPNLPLASEAGGKTTLPAMSQPAGEPPIEAFQVPMPLGKSADRKAGGVEVAQPAASVTQRVQAGDMSAIGMGSAVPTTEPALLSPSANAKVRSPAQGGRGVTPAAGGGAVRAGSRSPSIAHPPTHLERAMSHEQAAVAARARKDWPAWVNQRMRAVGHRLASAMKQERPTAAQQRPGSVLAGSPPHYNPESASSARVRTPAAAGNFGNNAPS